MKKYIYQVRAAMSSIFDRLKTRDVGNDDRIARLERIMQSNRDSAQADALSLPRDVVRARINGLDRDVLLQRPMAGKVLAKTVDDGTIFFGLVGENEIHESHLPRYRSFLLREAQRVAPQT